MLEVSVAGESLTLLAERAIWWERTRTLLIADVHLGKPAAFRAGGIAVPESVTGSDLARLDALLERFDARRLVVLGDLLHARTGRTPETLHQAAALRERHAHRDFMLVRGNHDRSSGDPPAALGFACVEPGEADGAFAFAHEPREFESRFTLCGHIHPAVRMSGLSPHAGSMRARCFWLRPAMLVLPAFGSFTGSETVRPEGDDRVFVVGEDRVLEANAVRTGRGKSRRRGMNARG